MTKKITQLPQQASPTTADKVPLVSGGVTDYVLLSDLITLFFNNIPSGAHSDVTRWSETGFDFVASGLVLSGDSYGVNKNASMTAGVIYINGRRISISAVTARVYTASKDTYVDVLDNTDGTGTLVYTEVANNAASPALASNSVRIGIVVTGATTIAAAGSVNQGQETMLLPIASSTPYAVTDSLGNLICSRDSVRRTLALRQVSASQSFTTVVDGTGLTFTCIVPTARKIELELSSRSFLSSSANDNIGVAIMEGATEIDQIEFAAVGTAGNANMSVFPAITLTPTAGSHTYKITFTRTAGAGTCQMLAAATRQAQFRAHLV